VLPDFIPTFLPFSRGEKKKENAHPTSPVDLDSFHSNNSHIAVDKTSPTKPIPFLN